MEANPMFAQRRNLIAISFALQFAWGLRNAFNPANPEIVLVAIAAGVVATQFCIVDSKIIGNPLPWSLSWLIFGTWTLAVPIYLIRTRGWKRLHRIVLWGILWILAAVIPFYAVEYILYGIE